MRTASGWRLVPLVAVVALGLAVLADVPGTLLPASDAHALALEDGVFHAQADPAADVLGAFEAGTTFVYYGETAGAFGRVWSVVGDPAAWSRQRRWLVAPELDGRAPPLERPVAFLGGLGAPPASATAAMSPIRVQRNWWRWVEAAALAEPPEAGEGLGVPAFRVPEEIAREALRLHGGTEAMGPWPEDPAHLQLYVPARLPLVFHHDDGWTLGASPRSLSPYLGVLANPALEIRPDAPTELIGKIPTCWRLVGAMDPAGMPVGRAAAAPTEPATRPAGTSDDPLGALDLGPRTLPTAPVSVAAPRRVLMEEESVGALVEDSSNRQAVYLEQVLPAEVTHGLRGREVRLRVRARAVPQGETVSTAAVSIELTAGDAREVISAQVGTRATALEVALTVPEDADRITVRLIPQDPSIAVQERGAAVFDSADLTPAEWPRQLVADPLRLRRYLVVGYVPARRFTRTALAVREVPAGELRATWTELAGASERSIERMRRIVTGRLVPGMSPADVRLAWGEPDETTRLEGFERWEWTDRSAAFEPDSGLLTWTMRPELEPDRRIPCSPRPARAAPASAESGDGSR